MSAFKKSPTFSSMSQNLQKIWKNFLKNSWENLRNAWKVLSKLNWTNILVYSSALQCKKVQSSIEKFHRSKNLRKTENFSFNPNIKVPLESVELFMHVFLCLKVLLTLEHYIKLLAIFIWKFAIIWSWQLALWNLWQLAPASFFNLQQAHIHHVWDIYVSD